jgi:hypothetical protein
MHLVTPGAATLMGLLGMLVKRNVMSTKVLETDRCLEQKRD